MKLIVVFVYIYGDKFLFLPNQIHIWLPLILIVNKLHNTRHWLPRDLRIVLNTANSNILPLLSFKLFKRLLLKQPYNRAKTPLSKIQCGFRNFKSMQCVLFICCNSIILGFINAAVIRFFEWTGVLYLWSLLHPILYRKRLKHVSQNTIPSLWMVFID